MGKEPYNMMWGALLRTSQELLYESVGPSVERQLPELQQRADRFAGKLGSLELYPSLAIPGYHAAVNIHCKPGGYHSELHGDNDIFAGAEYDRTVHMYLMGAMGPNNDDFGRSAARWLKRAHPEIVVRRVLDMGCTIGHSTLAWCDEYPDAEIHAIDVAAPCLRYAHARAEALGLKIHFSQQSAEHTKFKDASFDLITSNILAHETSTKAWPAIIKECHRLLKPGGVMIHADLPQLNEIDPYRQFIYTNETHYNNEPFWTKYRTMDLKKVATEAGFLPENVIRDFSQVKGGKDQAKIDAAIETSRSAGYGAPPGSPLGMAFLIGIKE